MSGFFYSFSRKNVKKGHCFDRKISHNDEISIVTGSYGPANFSKNDLFTNFFRVLKKQCNFFNTHESGFMLLLIS